MVNPCFKNATSILITSRRPSKNLYTIITGNHYVPVFYIIWLYIYIDTMDISMYWIWYDSHIVIIWWITYRCSGHLPEVALCWAIRQLRRASQVMGDFIYHYIRCIRQAEPPGNWGCGWDAPCEKSRLWDVWLTPSLFYWSFRLNQAEWTLIW